MDIIFNGTSCPIKYLHIGVQGNNLVDKIVFCVPRKTSDGLDLSEFTPYIKIQNVKKITLTRTGNLRSTSTTISCGSHIVCAAKRRCTRALKCNCSLNNPTKAIVLCGKRK